MRVLVSLTFASAFITIVLTIVIILNKFEDSIFVWWIASLYVTLAVSIALIWLPILSIAKER